MDFVQDTARRLVLRMARAPAGGELLFGGSRPRGDPITMTCMDDCNFIRNVSAGGVTESDENKRHVAACCGMRSLQVSPNAAEGVLNAIVTPLLGGELHAKVSFLHIIVSTVQHFVCLWGFAAGFRRPLYSVCQPLFRVPYEHEEGTRFFPFFGQIQEVLPSIVLSVFALTSMRSPILDGSLSGSGADEASTSTSTSTSTSASTSTSTCTSTTTSTSTSTSTSRHVTSRHVTSRHFPSLHFTSKKSAVPASWPVRPPLAQVAMKSVDVDWGCAVRGVAKHSAGGAVCPGLWSASPVLCTSSLALR